MIEDPVRDDANVLAVSSFKGLKQDLVRFLETIILFHNFFNPCIFAPMRSRKH